jgi:bifunctional DNase/RNase
MKCSVADCYEDATVHIIEVRDRMLVSEKHVCEEHKWTNRPFSDPGSGITSLGSGVQGRNNRFELVFVVFFDRRQADSLFLQEVSGIKRFSIPVCRNQALSIMQALQRSGEFSRPFTFTAFALVVESLGGKLEEVVVDAIEGKGEFYYTKVRFRQGSRLAVVDIRPSDAFGLAIACDAPILIADSVLERAAELGWTRHSGD